MKWSVARAHRDVVRAAMEQVFHCQRRSPSDELDLFDFDDGAMVGVFYVDERHALSAAQQHDRGVWLEFFVDDPEATLDALVRAGLSRVTDGQTAHPYAQFPGGGPVFRLSKPV